MIPTRGWRDREARALSRNRSSLDPVVSAELARIMAEREIALEAQADAERAAKTRPSGPVTAAQMLENVAPAPAPVPDDVTPDEDEAPEAALEEPAEDAHVEPEPVAAPEAPEAAPEAPEAAPEAPEAAPVAPKPKTRAKKA